VCSLSLKRILKKILIVGSILGDVSKEIKLLIMKKPYQGRNIILKTFSLKLDLIIGKVMDLYLLEKKKQQTTQMKTLEKKLIVVMTHLLLLKSKKDHKLELKEKKQL